MKPVLKLESVGFCYHQDPVVDDISLQVKAGEIACLVGPSGCGKSTLLRLIAGFEQPHRGNIYIHQELVANAKKSRPPQHRQVGMLFQNLALFPHMTVAENIGFGLQDKTSANQRINELLSLCRLADFNQRYPHQLSGGQRQRVALARAMAPKPRIILLDEPFSSVESELQSELADEVKNMLKADGSSVLWVTHSIEESFAVADQIGVMLKGRLLEWSTPEQLYAQPQTAGAVKFLNQANLINGDFDERGYVSTALGHFKPVNTNQLQPNRATQLALKQQHIKLTAEASGNAVVKSCVYQGGFYALTLNIDAGQRLKIKHHLAFEPGTTVQVKVSGSDLVAYQS